ncbi:neuromodulin-like [Chelonus insularis]|uniref:neuromodulin-like n=1 Tax=Chelonus insularis TaxID=460826 RepID=UPI00158A6154|nr:neuromodulin-like [Chelonus insularis]
MSPYCGLGRARFFEAPKAVEGRQAKPGKRKLPVAGTSKAVPPPRGKRRRAETHAASTSKEKGAPGGPTNPPPPREPSPGLEKANCEEGKSRTSGRATPTPGARGRPTKNQELARVGRVLSQIRLTDMVKPGAEPTGNPPTGEGARRDGDMAGPSTQD